MLNNKNRKHKMKNILVILIIALSLTGCGSIGAYTENNAETQVNFSQYNVDTDSYVEKHANLKVVETGLVTGSTLLYSAQGNSAFFGNGHGNTNVTYPLWINESEVDDVEFAINKYRYWQDQDKPKEYTSIQPVNEYVSQWMNGVTFKFGLFNGKKGKAFLSICYEFSALGKCTFTYMIDEQSIELLSDDLEKFKLHSFEFHELAG
jgi:uncharacterized protein YceK